MSKKDDLIIISKCIPKKTYLNTGFYFYINATEEWTVCKYKGREIPNYYISSCGRVFCISKEKLCNLIESPDHYLRVVINLNPLNETTDYTTISIERLMLYSFKGNPPKIW